MKNTESTKKLLLFLSWRDIKAPKRGGAEVFTHEMAKRAVAAGWKVIHFSPHYEGGAPAEVIDGVQYLRQGDIRTVIFHAYRFYKKHRHDISYVVDQCNTHQFFSPLWVEPEKRIFFIHQLTREIWFINLSFPFSLLGFLSETPLLKIHNRDPALTVSSSTKQDLIDVGFTENRVWVLPEGIDFDPWPKEEWRKKERETTFIYVGRMANYKGIDAAVKAFIRFRRTHGTGRLWVVGKKNEEYLEKEIYPLLKEAGISWGDEDTRESSVSFLGFVSEEEKLDRMSRAHALLFPSRREGWGLIVTEAAAVGTPSVVYDSPGIRDAVDHGKAGYMVSRNTPEQIFEKMEGIKQQDDDYSAMQESAYDFATRFHWDHTGASFIKFMERKESEQ
ncbi:glycosyltransferase family 4 protein [Salimicrobium sp. PL1-032A]|uniref:glycosyltransferase family 4 protein n=1 Tax=Salimicrobium sp. PL1-032A TaxID=3095364 RepID=UPI0032602AB9